MHARGLLHGDVYGHNILHDDKGHALLGDFGAASFIGTGGPAPALERLEVICDTYLSVSTPVQVAASELLERGASVREQIARRLSINYECLRQKVAAATPACRVLASEGGWSAVLQVPSFESEEALVVDLLEEDGVLTHPGYFFDFPRESYLVMSLLVSEAQFADGTDRVLRRFECPVVSHD